MKQIEVNIRNQLPGLEIMLVPTWKIGGFLYHSIARGVGYPFALFDSLEDDLTIGLTNMRAGLRLVELLGRDTPKDMRLKYVLFKVIKGVIYSTSWYADELKTFLQGLEGSDTEIIDFNLIKEIAWSEVRKKTKGE